MDRVGDVAAVDDDGRPLSFLSMKYQGGDVGLLTFGKLAFTLGDLLVFKVVRESVY